MLLESLLEDNPILQPEDLASVIFTVTEDSCSTYRQKQLSSSGGAIGWSHGMVEGVEEGEDPPMIGGIANLIGCWPLSAVY